MEKLFEMLRTLAVTHLGLQGVTVFLLAALMVYLLHQRGLLKVERSKVELERRRAETQPRTKEDGGPDKADAPTRPARTRSLVVIDDEPVFLEIAKVVLERQYPDATVRTSLGGAEALKILQTSTPDIVILDLQMPAVSGQDILRMLAKSKPDLPIVVYSGSAQDARALRGNLEVLRQLEHIAIVDKSPNWQTLLDRVEQLLRAAEAPPQAARWPERFQPWR